MKYQTSCKHQDQQWFPAGNLHCKLEIRRGGSQGQLYRAMGAGLHACQAQDAIAVVIEMCRVCSQWATCCL